MMDLEEVIRQFREAEQEYKVAWQENYKRRTESITASRYDHETRMELALGDIDPELRQRYYDAVTEKEIARAQLDQRHIIAEEQIALVYDRLAWKEPA